MSLPVRWMKGPRTVDYDDDLYWPICSEHEKELLLDLASVFEADLEWKNCQRRSGRGGVVLALGEQLFEDASLYARLSDRTAATIGDIDQISDFPAADIIVVSLAQIGARFFRRLSAFQSQHQTVGIILGKSVDDIRVQVLLKSAARYLSRTHCRSNKRILDLLPQTTFDQFKTKTRHLLGSQANEKWIKDALGLKYSLIRIVTVSDGIDADMGGGIILCNAHLEREQKGRRAPRCMQLQHCHRLGVPLPIRDHSKLISPARLRAEILVYDACQGLLTSSPVTDSRFGIGVDLARSPSLGALVTNAEFVVTSPLVTERIIAQLAKGTSLGESVLSYNRENGSLRHDLFVFGDPEICLDRDVSAGFDELQSAKPMKADLISINPNSADGDANLFNAAQASGLASMTTPMSTVLDSTKSAPFVSYGPTREAILHVARRRWARWQDDWMNFAVDVEPQLPPARCSSCGDGARTFTFRFSSAAARRAAICGRCGPIEDAPTSWSLKLSRAHLTGFVVSGDKPEGIWEAAFILFSDEPRETRIVRWIDQEEDLPVACQFDPPFEAGPLRAGFCLVGSSWALLTIPFRADEMAPIDTSGLSLPT